MSRFPGAIGLGLASFVIAACGGSPSLDERSHDGPLCLEPEPAEAPEGCGATRVWVRMPQSSECVSAFFGCIPEARDGGLWMQFNSLVECQAITCRAGDTRPAGDGCNTCSCATEAASNLERGYWRCTNAACGSAVPTGKACGYWEGVCNSGEFCAFSPADACSSTDAPSICITQPTVCTSEDAPVCGCNATTYPNRCGAARAGTGIRAMGACTRPGGPVACGARAGATCTDDEYCAYVTGDLCGAADAEATCRPRPAACIAMDAPVCGCDGKTYGNACEAAKAGTGTSSEGACCSK